MKLILKGFTLQELETVITDNGFPNYKAHQIYNWIYKQGESNINAMSNLSKDLKYFLNENAILNTLQLSKHIESKNTIKFLFKTHNDKYIESVSMIEDNRHTICLSSQVGCSVDCDFCATGKMGFIQNLNAGEIIDQLLFIKNSIKQPITNIVFMGMGEPFLNYNNVIKAAKLMNDQDGLNFAAHRITISTAGILPKINQFIDEKLKFNIAISLNASNNATRDELMPINKKWPISDLIQVAKQFNKNSRHTITFEYVLIDSINDSKEDAIQLTRLLKNSGCKLNIIPFNDIGNKYKRPSVERIEYFLDIIHQKHQGFQILVRWSKGVDINAGCGQLATQDIK
tara:strand:+ start:5879 stop:6904 length:1026 start_codon:yes stop_codon:yes gene_type:complete